MSLRLKIQWLVGLLTLGFLAGLLALQMQHMRESVREEVVAANRVASQLLNRLAWLYASQGTPAMLDFLQGVGRVRSNEIELFDASGGVLYRSPPSAYKAGRDAPEWFARLIVPSPSQQVYDFPDGRLVVTSNASRAALDSWDGFTAFLAAALALLVGVNLMLFWLVGRTVRPFGRIVHALGQLEAGRFDVELPPLPGSEAATIGAAFNRMVQVLRERLETERKLSASRELTRWIDHHIEQERRQIARELHDELGQSVTAIRSLALSVAQRTTTADPSSAAAARLIADESSRLYDAMHGMIPRLAPLVIDSLGLGPALDELAERTRRAHPGVSLSVQASLDGVPLSPDAALALYRAAQEGVTNALRHGQATVLKLRVQGEQGVDGAVVRLTVEDNGRGLVAGWSERAGHHGLRWLDERVSGLGGRLSVASLAAAPGTPAADDAGSARGVRLEVVLPCDHAGIGGRVP